ncbi:hypothetical protein Bbelb_072170 [Branchiostoma belcheri]|nr:hypothetical protein Bbelb_072170 [Branchiostoma belcheri]
MAGLEPGILSSESRTLPLRHTTPPKRRDLTVRTPTGTPPVAHSPPGHICYVTDQMNRIKPKPARLLSPTGAGRGYIPDRHRRNWDRSLRGYPQGSKIKKDLSKLVSQTPATQRSHSEWHSCRKKTEKRLPTRETNSREAVLTGLKATRVICRREGRFAAEGDFATERFRAKPSLRGKNSLGSKSSLAAAYYAQRKNNADAQQDCEGG